MNQLKHKVRVLGIALTAVVLSPFAVAGTALEANNSYSAWDCTAINSTQSQFITRVGNGITNKHSTALFVTCPLELDWAVIQNIRSNNGSVMFDINIGYFPGPVLPPSPFILCYGQFIRIVFLGSLSYNFYKFNAPLATASHPFGPGFSGTGPFAYTPIVRSDAVGDPFDSANLLCLLPSGSTLISYNLKIF